MPIPLVTMRQRENLEFAVGIRWEQGKALAVMANANQSRTTIPCAQLATAGLPVRLGARTPLTTDFSTWQPASFNEFVCANDARPQVDEHHQTWQFMHGECRYVVPALVLMRGLFKPTKAVLPWLYRMQSLEEICEFSGDQDRSPIASLTSLGKTTFRRDQGQLVRPLSWMYCFSSARQMWASVYHHGRDGRIALQLPAAKASFVLTGVRHAHNVYVSAIHVDAIEALEEPFEFSPGHIRTISYMADSWMGRRNMLRPKTEIPMRGRQSKLSDAEWDAVRPHLDAYIFTRETSVSPRSMLDGVLKKLCHGTPWRETRYPAGVTHAAASTALHRWRKSGRWAKIEEELRRSRGVPGSTDLAGKTK